MPAQTAVGPLAGRPLIFGEVLYDHFPDGSAVLGGAPFNVAWHLHGFGAAPLFLSRVGQDAEGRRIEQTMCDWGMDVAGLQRDASHPTGAVRVSLRDGQPEFDILDRQAYDQIDTAQALAALGDFTPALLYHGTLALRSATTHSALIALRRHLAAGASTGAVPVFVDINLRAPWWNLPLVNDALRDVRWAKLNELELAEVAGRSLTRETLVEAGQAWRAHHGLDLLVLTLGAEGAWLLGPGFAHFGEPVPVPHVADTVGAGDAFSAVTLLGLLRGWAPQTTLQRALAFASRICGQHGATAADTDLYREFLDTWKHADKTTQ